MERKKERRDWSGKEERKGASERAREAMRCGSAKVK